MRFRSCASLMLVATLSVACSDSTAPAITLTDEEVGLLFAEITQAANSASESAALGSNLMAAATSVTTTTSSSADCPRGGKFALSGTLTQNSATTITITGSESFTACKTEHFTIGGSLHLSATINSPNDSTGTVQETLKGTLDVTHVDGRKGSCPIDLTLNLSFAGDAFDSSAAGTICGRSAESTIAVPG